MRPTAPSPRGHWIGLALLVALTTACSGVDTTHYGDFDPQAIETYAWQRMPAIDDPAGLEENGRLMTRVRETVDRELRARGLTPADPGAADVLVDVRLAVEERLQTNDPNFSLYIAEKWEEGFLTIAFLDARGERLWEGKCEHRLRYASRSMGGTRPRFEPTDESRDWRVEPLVERILSEAFPR